MAANEPVRLGTHDLRHYFFPLYEVTFARLASGQLPQWNPHHLTGIPWLATLQAGVFYPPHLLYVVLPTQLALALSNVVHLVLLGLGSAWFARRLGLGREAAAFTALLFVTRGMPPWWIAFPNALEAGTWLPFGAVGALGLARGEGIRAGRLLAAVTALSLLAGHTQVTLFCGYAWASLLAAALYAESVPLRRGLAIAVVFAGALALGGLVSAVQTLPTFELTLEGTRGTSVLSSAQAAKSGSIARDLVSGSDASLGVLPLLLGAAALLAVRRRAVAVWALAVAAASYALAAGSDTGLVEVYRALPLLGWFRDPQRLVFLTQFALAVAAGIGFEELARRLDAGRRPAWALAVALLLVAAESQLATSHRGRMPYDAAAAAGYRDAEADFVRLAELADGGRVLWSQPWPPIELKLGARHGLLWLDDYEPLTLRRQSEYFTYLHRGAVPSPEVPAIFQGAILPLPRGSAQQVADWVRGVSRRDRLFDLAATRIVLAPPRTGDGDAAAGWLSAAGLVERPFESARFSVYERRNALPRAFVSYDARPAPATAELLGRLARADFDPLTRSYVEDARGLPRSETAPARGGPATIVRDDATRVEVEAVLEAPGLLVLADAYARGWSASVDGSPARIFATNHLFRGVPVPEGRHRVIFEYRAPGLALGAALSLAGVAVLALAWRREEGA